MSDMKEKIIHIPELQDSKAGFQVNTTNFDNLLKQENLSNDTKAIIQSQKYNYIALVDFSMNYDYWMRSYIYPYIYQSSNFMDMIYSGERQ